MIGIRDATTEDDAVFDKLKELSGLSKQLNEKCDKLNLIISSINEKLLKLNFGVEAWLYEFPLKAGEGYKLHDTCTDKEVYCEDAVVFGYCLVREKWELALKLVSLQTEESGDVDRVDKPHSTYSLLTAGRSERILAMKLLPELLDKFKTEAESIIEEIDKVERVSARL